MFLDDEIKSNGPEQATTRIHYTLEVLTIPRVQATKTAGQSANIWIRLEFYQTLQ